MSGQLDVADLFDVAMNCATAVRHEILGVLQGLELPLATIVDQPIVTLQGDSGASWRIERNNVNVLRLPSALWSIPHDYVWTLQGATELAEVLLTRLGDQLAWETGGIGGGFQVISESNPMVDFKDDEIAWTVRHVCEPLVLAYLKRLEDLTADDATLLMTLLGELLTFLQAPGLPQQLTLAFSGITSSTEALANEGFSVRPLNSHEIGALSRVPDRHNIGDLDLGNGTAFEMLRWPTHLLTYAFESKRDQQDSYIDDASRVQNFLTGLSLLGANVNAVSPIGRVTTKPHWLSSGAHGTPPLAIHSGRFAPVGAFELSPETFARALGLAAKIPMNAWRQPKSYRDVVFHRYMQASTREQDIDRILDYVVALESCLVHNNIELAHRFSLYGAVFLSNHADERFALRDDFHLLYGLRSRLAHGTRFPSASEITAGAKRARELADRVLTKCLEDGWPNNDDLDSVLLR